MTLQFEELGLPKVHQCDQIALHHYQRHVDFYGLIIIEI